MRTAGRDLGVRERKWKKRRIHPKNSLISTCDYESCSHSSSIVLRLSDRRFDIPKVTIFLLLLRKAKITIEKWAKRCCDIERSNLSVCGETRNEFLVSKPSFEAVKKKKKKKKKKGDSFAKNFQRRERGGDLVNKGLDKDFFPQSDQWRTARSARGRNEEMKMLVLCFILLCYCSSSPHANKV